MNGNLNNIISYMKEVIKLKEKNTYDIKEFLYNIMYNGFNERYSDAIAINDLDTSMSNNEVLTLKYVLDSNIQVLPAPASTLEKYVTLKDNKVKIASFNNLEDKLKEDNLVNEFNTYISKVNKINKVNKNIKEYNDIYLRLYNYYKKMTDYEEKLEIVLASDMLVYKNGNNVLLKRHILEQPLKLEIDSLNNSISFLIDSSENKRFVTDFLNFNGYKIKDISKLNEIVNNFKEEYVLNAQIDMLKYKQDYLNAVSYENEIKNTSITKEDIQNLDDNKMYLFNDSHIIIRNKNTKLWIEEFDNIQKVIETEKIQSNILNLLDVDFTNKELLDTLLVDSNPKAQDVLFPLETNIEQCKIVKRMENSNIVLVQGPPGTGKSHTITNLIAHYIAKGETVAVVSEKSKALEVVQDKLPDSIKSLCISILSNKATDKDLEYSIDNILKMQEKAEELDTIENNIFNLERSLNTVKLDKEKNEKEILELMYLDGLSYRDRLSSIITTNKYNCNLIDVAKYLKDNSKFNIIPLEDNDKKDYDLVYVNSLFKEINKIATDIYDNNYSLTKPISLNNVITDDSLNHLIELVITNNKYILKNKDIIKAIKFKNITIEKIDKILAKVNDFYNIVNTFEEDKVFEIVKYTVSIDSIKDILQNIKEHETALYTVEKSKLYYDIKYDETKLNDYIIAVNNILKCLSTKQTISLAEKIKYSNDIKLLKEIKIGSVNTDTQIYNKEVLEIVKSKLDIEKQVVVISYKLNAMFKQDVLNLLNISKNEFGKKYVILEKILTYILNIDDNLKEITMLFDDIINNEIFNVDIKKLKYEQTLSVIEDLKYFESSDEYVITMNEKIEELNKFYENDKLVFLGEYIYSIRSLNLFQFKEAKAKLNREINTINRYYEIKEENKEFFEDKENFIKKYIYEYTLEEKETILENIEKIFKYHYVNKFYNTKESNASKLDILFENKLKLENLEKEKTLKLIEIKGWYNQIKNMNPVIIASLGKWMNHKRKYGKGTGKNSNLYLQNMQREMEVARKAIPVWIMPIEKLILQYPFRNKPYFDVIIIDESSQTSVLAITALTRGKKVIVVGDDKQINPINVAQKQDVMNNLRIKYLNTNPWGYLLERNTSIYDIVQTICNTKKIVLTEHFRCLPEIINYSKYEYYNGLITPLRVRSVLDTIKEPIKTIYVPEAVCSKIGNHVYNLKEINAMIEFIRTIEKDETYNGKTLGVILLQNSPTTIKMLLNLIIQNFGEDFIKRRKVKAGTALEFQGDERDVIILNMVVSNKLDNMEEYKFSSLTSEENSRLFNVASTRAKEQMVLLHSVKLEDLNVNCNRYKLLKYCLTYNIKNEVTIENLFSNEFEKDVYNSLNSDKIKLVPKYVIGDYVLDFIALNDKGYKIAIMCDGDEYYSNEDYKIELAKQKTLERCGWKFIRIRASSFYYKEDMYVNSIINEIKEYLY